jgi:tetratricopeptide (TPR) repeat protein
MSLLSDKRHRHVVPRWRDSLTASISRDIIPLKQRLLPAKAANEVPTDILLLAHEFQQNPSVGVAADLMGSAVAAGHPEYARPSAEFIMRHANEAPSLLVQVATSVLNNQSNAFGLAMASDPRIGVSRLRSRLQIYPRSATMWADLSRLQASLGDIDKAKRSMRISLSLAPDNRWVLRSANRLLLHAEDYRAAHQMLITHPRTRHDPWLMAAEIASAQLMRIPPRFLARGRELLRHPAFAPVHLSELAAAVATSELESGQRKGARRLLRMAIKDPTENALAQIEWADRVTGEGLQVEQKVSRMTDAFEATFWVKRHEGQIRDAYKAALDWMHDEPFADQPVGAASHCAAILDDYDGVLRITQQGLARNPGSLLHRNNQIFAMLSGDLGTEDQFLLAISFLQHRLEARGEDFVHVLANAGLLQYRLGHFEDGAEFYRTAVRVAETSAGSITTAQAAAFHLREAALAKVPWIEEVLDVARKGAEKAKDGAVDFMMRKFEDLARNPDQVDSILGPDSAMRYLPKSKVNVARELKMTMTDKGPVLIVPAHLRR